MMIKNLNSYNKDGFTIVRKLLNKKKLKEYEKEIERINNILIKKYKPPYVNLTKDLKVNTAHHINKIFPRSKLMELGKLHVLNHLLRSIFNKKPILRNVEIFAKPPKTGFKAPFHQDNFYWNIKNKKGANVWIALDKVNKNNGGMIYLKGSHKLGILKHTLSNVPGSSQEINIKKVRKIKFKKISPTLNPGDCIIHHCEVIHGSNRNLTKKKRRAIVVKFTAFNSKIDKKKMNKYLDKLKKKLNSN